MQYVFVSFLISLVTLSAKAWAEKVNGHLELGGFLSTEKFNPSIGSVDNSDYELFTFRSFLSVSEIGDSKYEFNSDIRDKYDFFDTLNQADLTLTPANTFQIYQLNFRKPVLNQEGYGYTIGRTPVPEAGSAFVDGYLGHYKFFADYDLGWFGGLNPKISGQPYLNFNSDAYTGGVFLSYLPKSFDWNHAFYMSHALVWQNDEGHTDREYLFHNMSWQWGTNSRLITFLYLDFVPNLYIQEGSVYWQQGYTNKTYGKVELMGVSAIEYVHIQNVIDSVQTLPYPNTGDRYDIQPSAYNQAAYKFDYQSSPLVTWEAGVLYGHRDYDGLSKTEYAISMADQRSFGPNWDTNATVGYRNNFVSRDEFARVGLGYYSRSWEAYLSAEAGVRDYFDAGYTRHPLLTEVGLSHFWNKQLYLTWSFDREANEDVQILSTFFKVGFRYGNREIPPLRDGSPVKGTL
jgi:hypothetical protein